MEPIPDKPNSLEAQDAAALARIFDRAKAGEFKCIALEYGHGRPGKSFCKVGVIWPQEKQAEFL